MNSSKFNLQQFFLILFSLVVATVLGTTTANILGNKFSGLNSAVLVGLLAFAFFLAISIIALRVRNKHGFTLLTFYSSLFLLEIVMGAVAATLRQPLPFKAVLTPFEIQRGVVVALLGYLLFLLGYGVRNISGDHSTYYYSQGRFDHIFFLSFRSHRYQVGYFILLFLTIWSSFGQTIQRIATAGGIEAFATTAYQYRYGTFTFSAEENAYVVLRNLLGSSALPLLSLGLMAWWRRYLINNFSKMLVGIASCMLATSLLLSGFRSTIFFSFVAISSLYMTEKRLSTVQKFGIFLVGALMLITVNFAHLLLYYLTAGREYTGILESLSALIAPQGHLETLVRVLAVSDLMPKLEGKGFIESIFFFIPRLFWHSKLPSSEYGTLLVQTWAGLPNWYQKAITNSGELIAHFGYIGMLGMVLYGRLYSFFDTFPTRGMEFRVGFFCLLLPRVLVDVGMGLSAIAVTVFNLCLFLIITYCLRRFSTFNTKTDRSIRGFRRKISSVGQTLHNY